MGSCTYLPATFKKRVTIQTASRVADGQGGSTETWVDGDTVACSIDPYQGGDRFQAGQMAAPVTHRITMRFHRSVTTGCRLKYGTRVFTVKEALNPGEDNRFLKLKAVELPSVAFVPDVGAIALRSGGFLLLRDGGKTLLRA